MSNMNPDTSGLTPFNKMDANESRKIQSAGGTARAEKARKLKTTREIIQGLRATSDVDPMETAIANLYSNLSNPMLSVNEQLRAITALSKLCGEDKPTKD